MQFNEGKESYESNCITFWAPITKEMVDRVKEDTYYISTTGKIYSKSTNSYLNTRILKGRSKVSLCTDDRTVKKTKAVSKLMLQAFDPIEGYVEENYKRFNVEYLDGDATNNTLENIRWASQSDIVRNNINNGSRKVFGNQYKSYLTDNDLEDIIKRKHNGMSLADIYTVYQKKYPDLSFNTLRSIYTGSNNTAYRHEHGIKVYKSRDW